MLTALLLLQVVANPAATDSAALAQGVRTAAIAVVQQTYREKPPAVQPDSPIWVDVGSFARGAERAGVTVAALDSLPTAFGSLGRTGARGKEVALACLSTVTCQDLRHGLVVDLEHLAVSADSMALTVKVWYTDARGTSAAYGFVQYLVTMRQTDTGTYRVAQVRIGSIT